MLEVHEVTGVVMFGGFVESSSDDLWLFLLRCSG